MEYLDKWASFGKDIKFLIFWIISHKNISYGSGWGASQSQKTKNWGSQKNWPDRAKLSMQYFIFHQTLPDPHSEPNACFGLLDRVIKSGRIILTIKLFLTSLQLQELVKYKVSRILKNLIVKPMCLKCAMKNFWENFILSNANNLIKIKKLIYRFKILLLRKLLQSNVNIYLAY